MAHRDIKLENVMMTGTQKDLKLVDFGLSKIVQPNDRCTTPCGSADYAAPEVFMGDPYDGTKSDIWSLGVVLYAIVAGGMPFAGLQDALQGNYVPLENSSPELESIVASMLKVDPKDRPSLDKLAQSVWMMKGEFRPFKINAFSKVMIRLN